MKYKRIEIFYRQTARNKISPTRVSWFDYEKSFKNLLDTINWHLCNLTVCFDGSLLDYENHFTRKYQSKYNFRVMLIDTKSYSGKSYQYDGSSKSGCLVAEIIKKDNLPEDSLIAVFENDYIFQELDWATIVLDLYNNLTDQNCYISLYDHLDKYIFVLDNKTIKDNNLESHWGMYRDLKSKIILSSYCHWREVPLICSTWIFSKQLFDKHEKYHSIGMSDNSFCGQISKEFATFFLSPVPSLNCHSEKFFISPFINWQKILDDTKLL